MPPYAATGGELHAYSRWLGLEIARRDQPVSLAGHSMGAGLAILAAAERPAAIERLILLSPVGLPLDKPLGASLATFLGQILRGWYPARELSRAVGSVLRAPSAALALARTVHELDLGSELGLLKDAPVPITVVGCSSDRLTTSEHCRRLAGLLGAGYRELDARGGHIWMIVDPGLLAITLSGEALNLGRRRSRSAERCRRADIPDRYPATTSAWFRWSGRHPSDFSGQSKEISRVTSKLQVTIPKAIAQRYGIEPGVDVEWLPAGDAIRVVPPTGHARGPDRNRRLELFDRATERESARAGGRSERGATVDRGWRRDDIYEHGLAD